VRALADEGKGAAQEATRDYVLTVDGGAGEPPLVSVYGGKITTYRRLAEGVMARLPFPGRPWTATAPLPGGDLGPGGLAGLIEDLQQDYPAFAPAHLARLAKAYGFHANLVLGAAKTPADLGQTFTADLTRAEVDYLVAHEWARTAEDVLWRRTKLGLVATPTEVERLRKHLGA
jgi:glycerol-3-phosphate dehydrogenase